MFRKKVARTGSALRMLVLHAGLLFRRVVARMLVLRMDMAPHAEVAEVAPPHLVQRDCGIAAASTHNRVAAEPAAVSHTEPAPWAVLPHRQLHQHSPQFVWLPVR